MDITSRELERSDNCLFVELKFTWACGLHYLPSQPKSTLLGSHMGGWKHLVHPDTPIVQTHPKTHPIIDNYPLCFFMLESGPRPEQCKEQMSSHELHTEWQRFTQNYTWRILIKALRSTRLDKSTKRESKRWIPCCHRHEFRRCFIFEFIY